MSVRVALALGSNLGRREEALAGAVSGLKTWVTIDAVSSVWASAPVGYADQPDFLNAAVAGRTELEAEDLLRRGRELEAAAGRERSFRNAPRPLDVDLVFFGDRIAREPGLTLPHPRFRERSFVLAPLREVAPDWVDPVTGRTVEEIWTERRGDLPEIRRVGPPESIWRPAP